MIINDKEVYISDETCETCGHRKHQVSRCCSARLISTEGGTLFRCDECKDENAYIKEQCLICNPSRYYKIDHDKEEFFCSYCKSFHIPENDEGNPYFEPSCV